MVVPLFIGMVLNTFFPDLMKIGGFSFGSRLKSGHAEETSHMMFGSVLRGMASLFATHPPLDERIRSIMPEWDGQFEAAPMSEINATPRHEENRARPPVAPAAGVSMLSGGPQEIVARVGMLSPADMENAARLREGIPPELLQLLHDASGAQAVVFGLLISTEGSAESQTLANLVDEQTLHTARAVAEHVAGWHSTHAIALIDLSIPALRRLTPEEYRRFAAIRCLLWRGAPKVL